MMRRIALILRELFGLFVDDAGFALTILVWLTRCALLLPQVPLPLAWRGALLFTGLAVILVWHCLRHTPRATHAMKRNRVRTASDGVSKVPEITVGFWIIKIAATTLGETGGDTVTMTLSWGYLAGTALFLAALIVLVIAQILAKRFRPFLYWATIVASTTFGTTMADFADRSLGIGYTGGSTLLLCASWSCSASGIDPRVPSP